MMTKRERYNLFVDYFSQNAPDAATELLYDNGYQLIVAVILSAQCTDLRVNKTTPKLFERYPTIHDLASANEQELFTYIHSISYPNNKTKHLIQMAQRVVAVYNAEIPSDVHELQTLAGVGRKTANVVASVLYNQPRMAVDTHVFRVSKRIGLTTQVKTPLECELQLIKYLPVHTIHQAHHWLILHGRYMCTARSPKCTSCGISYFCKHFKKRK